VSNEYLIEAYYDNIEKLLKEAAAYVKGNGKRKKAEIDKITPSMKYHKDEYDRLVKKVNRIATDLIVCRIQNPEVLFYDYIANTDTYKHKITKGDKKGDFDKRTISSARIKGYRRIIKACREDLVPIPMQTMEKMFRETKEYREIHR
jgi:hypothetical protein